MQSAFGWTRMILNVGIVMVLFFSLGARGSAQDTQGVPQPIPDVASAGSPAELQVSQQTIERRLSAVDSQVNSWKFVINSLTSLDGQVTAAAGPTKQDFDKLAELVKNKDFPRAKIQLQTIMQGYQALVTRIGVLNVSEPLDPDVSLLVSQWDQKLSQITTPLNRDLGSLYPIAYEQVNLRPGDLNVDDLRQRLAPEAFAKYKGAIVPFIESDLKLATQTKDSLTQEESRLQNQLDDISKKLAKGKLEINQLAIELGLPLFCGTVLLMLSIPIVIQSFSRASAGSAEQVRAIFSSGILVEIITVLLLTMSILILGLANRIEGPVLGTLLGGISGYVLNRFRGKNQGGPDNEQRVDPVVPRGPKGAAKSISAPEPPEMPPTSRVEDAETGSEFQFGSQEH